MIVDQVLDQFLFAADSRRLSRTGGDVAQSRQAQFPMLEAFAVSRIKAVVSFLQQSAHFWVLPHAIGYQQAPGECIHAADVGDEHVFEIRGFSSDPCVKVQSAAAQSAGFDRGDFAAIHIEKHRLERLSAEIDADYRIHDPRPPPPSRRLPEIRQNWKMFVHKTRIILESRPVLHKN